jgi:hypothetical protein
MGLDPVGELRGFPLVPCPDCGMARVVEGQTQNEGENHGHLYFKCARNSVSSLLYLPNLSLGSYVLLILQYAKNCGFYHFPQGVSPDAEGCWHHCFSTVELGRRGR